jgi:hypothetical protein
VDSASVEILHHFQRPCSIVLSQNWGRIHCLKHTVLLEVIVGFVDGWRNMNSGTNSFQVLLEIDAARLPVTRIDFGFAAMHRMGSLAIKSPWANNAEQLLMAPGENGVLQLESQISVAGDEVASDISCRYMGLLHLTWLHPHCHLSFVELLLETPS